MNANIERLCAIPKHGTVILKDKRNICGGPIYSSKQFVACGLQAMQSSIELDRKQQSERYSHKGKLLKPNLGVVLLGKN